MANPVQQLQFGRAIKLIVAGKNGAGLDLSLFRIKFSVKKSGVMTPNVADIRVYNLDPQTAASIQAEFTQVVLQAGYLSNLGVIFQGNIKQCIIGRESATDTFIDIIAGDGDQAYCFAIINKSIAAGSDASQHIAAAFDALASQGVSQGYNGISNVIGLPKLPRGKVMYGNARDHIRQISNSNNYVASIQDEQTVFVKQTTYVPGVAVVLTTKTGMVGTPEQSVEGIKIKCLLNPKIKVHSRIKVDNRSVAQYKLDQFNPGSPANTPVPLQNDGLYYVLVCEHQGDTRGQEWYTNLVTLVINPSANALNGGDITVGAGSS